MTEWRDVAHLLARQHGVVAWHQLKAGGMSSDQLDALVATRRLERAAPRVWRVVGGDITWEQRLMCGLLSLGGSAAVSHRAAARLHRFDRATSDHVEFLVPRGERQARINEVVHSSKMFPPIDVVTVNGLRVTSATRTIIDLANINVHPDTVKAAIDSAVRLQLSAPEAIRIRLHDIRRRGRAGVRLIDRLLLDSGGHTMLERKFLELMRLASLPQPRKQAVVRENGRHVARVDFMYDEYNVVVEVSGRLGHSSPTERARDAQRRNELQALGLVVIEFTWEDVTTRPVHVQATMRRLLTPFLSPNPVASGGVW